MGCLFWRERPYTVEGFAGGFGCSPVTHLRMIPIFLALLVLCLAGPRVVAEEVVYRSLRAENHNQLDERHLPEEGLRTCHQGWEMRTRHFVVVCTSSAEQARWLAHELERSWSEIGRLADPWTAVHRQPTFGIGAVNVLVTDRPVQPRARPGAGPRNGSFEPDIYINLSDGPSRLPERLPQLRQEAFRAFLRVAQLDQVLPGWVQAGLAAYHAGGEPPPDEQARSAVLRVRYLLEGDDAQFAPALFSAMAATVSGHPQDPFSSAPGTHNGAWFYRDGRSGEQSALEEMSRTPQWQEGFRAWLADPHAGQPVVQPEPRDLVLDKRHLEMVLILKLARRFSAPAAEPIQPKVYERGTDRTAAMLPQTQPSAPLTLQALYYRLSDAKMGPWATLDTDGSLLLSQDRQRLAQLLADPSQQYRTYWRDGHAVLGRSFPSGEAVEAWLEENPKDPKRPIAHVVQKSSPGRAREVSPRVKDYPGKNAAPATE